MGQGLGLFQIGPVAGQGPLRRLARGDIAEDQVQQALAILGDPRRQELGEEWPAVPPPQLPLEGPGPLGEEGGDQFGGLLGRGPAIGLAGRGERG